MSLFPFNTNWRTRHAQTDVNDVLTQLLTPVLWTSTTYLTATGSADTTGLDADVFVEYIRLA